VGISEYHLAIRTALRSARGDDDLQDGFRCFGTKEVRMMRDVTPIAWTQEVGVVRDGERLQVVPVVTDATTAVGDTEEPVVFSSWRQLVDFAATCFLSRELRDIRMAVFARLGTFKKSYDPNNLVDCFDWLVQVGTTTELRHDEAQRERSAHYLSDGPPPLLVFSPLESGQLRLIERSDGQIELRELAGSGKAPFATPVDLFVILMKVLADARTWRDCYDSENEAFAQWSPWLAVVLKDHFGCPLPKPLDDEEVDRLNSGGSTAPFADAPHGDVVMITDPDQAAVEEIRHATTAAMSSPSLEAEFAAHFAASMSRNGFVFAASAVG
jgi:hypothetical protein